jgi:hypothetical protein
VVLAPRAVEAPGAVRVEALTVVQASGDARSRHADEAWRPLAADGVVAPGDAVSGRSVVLTPTAQVAWAFEVKGTATVGGAASLSLERGAVQARVTGTALDLVAGGLRVLATEALFSVSLVAAEVLVEVAEGSVELVDGASVRRTLRAPGRLRWTFGSSVTTAVASASRGVQAPWVPPRPWVLLDARGLPAGTHLSLDGVEVGEAPFSALVGSGRHRLGTAPPGEARSESWVELTGPFLATLAPPPEPEASQPDAATVARAQRAVRAALPRLAPCYEQWLKANPQASAAVELHLTVGPSGRVRSVRVVGDGLPRASAECLVRSAGRLALPAMGSEVELEVPLKLTTQH